MILLACGVTLTGISLWIVKLTTKKLLSGCFKAWDTWQNFMCPGECKVNSFSFGIPAFKTCFVTLLLHWVYNATPALLEIVADWKCILFGVTSVEVLQTACLLVSICQAGKTAVHTDLKPCLAAYQHTGKP